MTERGQLPWRLVGILKPWCGNLTSRHFFKKDLQQREHRKQAFEQRIGGNRFHGFSEKGEQRDCKRNADGVSTRYFSRIGWRVKS